MDAKIIDFAAAVERRRREKEPKGIAYASFADWPSWMREFIEDLHLWTYGRDFETDEDIWQFLKDLADWQKDPVNLATYEQWVSGYLMRVEGEKRVEVTDRED